MEILSAIIQLLGGLAMFLYGIEVMGDGLKNSSGEALKRVLEKVTGNVFMGVVTGTLVTAVIQSSTATIVLAVALIGAGVLTLKQAVSIVLGANIGTTVTAWLTNLAFMESGDNWLLWLFDTDTLAPIALFAGIVLLMFIKSNKTKTIGDICIGFGILFVGLMNMTGAVKGFSGSPIFMEFLSSFSKSGNHSYCPEFLRNGCDVAVPVRYRRHGLLRCVSHHHGYQHRHLYRYRFLLLCRWLCPRFQAYRCGSCGF